MTTKYHKAHEVVKGDPRIDGPYLDDIRADEERARREARAKARAATAAKIQEVEKATKKSKKASETSGDVE